mmetsp:Transcript_1989/g.6097  ORF Transcript_1989/g.6097 Transcript_1989/m.6097 type:complete len:414 (+) Transcript_1989:279-1520(+)
MFTQAGLQLLKQRTLQRLEEQLEQVGLSNNFIHSRANRFPDERLSDLLKLVDSLTKALEKLLESATVFHKGACVMHESAKIARLTVADFGSEAVKDQGAAMELAFDEENLRTELQNNVTKPIRLRLRELADIKNRIKEVEILRLEAASRRESAERLRFRPNVNPAQLGRAEDQYAEKQVQYEQMLLKLVDEFAVLKRDHQLLFTRAFNSLKLCQYRFAMSAAAGLGALCGEDTAGMEPVLSPGSSGSPSSPGPKAAQTTPPGTPNYPSPTPTPMPTPTQSPHQPRSVMPPVIDEFALQEGLESLSASASGSASAAQTAGRPAPSAAATTSGEGGLSANDAGSGEDAHEDLDEEELFSPSTSADLGKLTENQPQASAEQASSANHSVEDAAGDGAVADGEEPVTNDDADHEVEI